MQTAITFPTLSAVLWPSRDGSRALRFVGLALIGSLLLTLSAKIQVPFWPVPMTMQTFVVLVLGMAYGPRLGAATVALYLLEGAVGLPVFAGTPERGIGLAYMVGPTGGYLAGFLVAAALLGWLAERGWDRQLLPSGVAMLAALAIIFALGVGWLASIVGFGKAIELGFVPFILGDLLKTALGIAVMPLAWRIVGRR